MIANSLIAARVTADTKLRFTALAHQHGLSESTLIKRYVDAALLSASVLPARVPGLVEPVGRDARVCVRLQADDLLLLRARSAAREMPTSTYVSFLLRAHLRALTPLPVAELAAFKRAVAEVGTMGRNINQIAHAVNRGEAPTGPKLGELQSILRALDGLREHLKALIRVNLTSWSQGMKKRLIDLSGGQIPILDIVSYGRAVPRSFTPVQRELIVRTVNRSPEVMVKVSGGARTLTGVGKHLAYIGRDDFVLETDMGERIQETGFQKALTEDWDLDLEALWHQSERSVNVPRRSPKLVHNLIFSMPPGTPATKVLQAVRQFATNEWALKHRYAMVLHTNEAHPHVHVVVKARSEQGQRLNIRKATLREWRQQFASNLRELAVAANATERAVRGQSKSSIPDAIYRTAIDPDRQSTYLRKRAMTIYNDVRQRGYLGPERGKEKMLATRRDIERGWRDTGLILAAGGDRELAERVQRFVDRMPPPRTGNEVLIRAILSVDPPRKIEPLVRTR